MSTPDFEFHPQAGVGAEVTGARLDQPLDGDAAKILLHALSEYGVLFFHGQDLLPEQHIAFAESLGTININRFFTPVEGYPNIAEVRKEPGDRYNVGDEWHTDHSYDDKPALGSILYSSVYCCPNRLCVTVMAVSHCIFREMGGTSAEKSTGPKNS